MMSEYAKEIVRVPLLSEEETVALVIAMHNGDGEARKKLIEHNLRLVLKIAYKFLSTIDLPIEDLISIGSFGLIKAIDRYDLSKGAKLATLAFKYIVNAYKTHIYLARMQKRDNSNDISLNDAVFVGKDGDELTIESTIEDDGLPVDETVVESIKNETLREILKRLTKEERELLCLRYGIYDGVKHSLEDIAKQRGVTRERIRQKEEVAIMKLRHPSMTRKIKDFLEE